MELITLLGIILGGLVLLAAAAYGTVKISLFYRTCFGFSLWSGVFLLLLAFALLLVYAGSGVPENAALPVLAAVLCAFTIFRDIRLSGWIYGLLALLFQTVMTLASFFLLLLAAAGLLARAAAPARTKKSAGLCSGILRELKEAWLLLPIFLLRR